jgi:lipopolysaccharide biosynthesis glycosyltransferase
METVNLMYVSDETYALYLPVAIASVLENNSNLYFKIYILSGDISSKSILKLEALKKRYPNFELILRKVDESIFEDRGLKKWVNSYIVFARLIAEQLLPDVDKIISLDVDTLVLGSLKELWDIDLTDKMLAAVRHTEDPSSRNGLLAHPRQFPNPISEEMFYMGTLVMNLDQMRNRNMGSEFLMKTLDEVKDKLQLGELDVFNYVYKGEVVFIPRKWLFYYINKVEKVNVNDIIVVHPYPKPWQVFRFDVFGKIARKYFALADDILDESGFSLGYKLPTWQFQHLIKNKSKAHNWIKLLPNPLVKQIIRFDFWRIRRSEK